MWEAIYIAVSGPLYLSSTGITDMFAVFHMPQTGGNIYVVFITGKLILSVYIAMKHN